ncbi:hypothetical protein ACFVMC_28445 [Nocardia sp. NPDC127579]|uniref:hypothetical protein n=1 Tax=Nocardia sp. NPDC127579 TaxID=3345402 RepID=UPI00363A6BD1
MRELRSGTADQTAAAEGSSRSPQDESQAVDGQRGGPGTHDSASGPQSADSYRPATLRDLGFDSFDELSPSKRDGLEQALSVTEMVPAAQVRFTQRSISPATSDGLSITDLAAAMREGGWRGGPVHAVRWETGELASLDNRRVAAARMAELDQVPTAIHDPSDRLEDWPHEWDRARRERNALGVDIRELPDGTLRVGGDEGDIRHHRGQVAETWGEIALFRAAEQRSLLPGELKGSAERPVYAAKPADRGVAELPADDSRYISEAVAAARPAADRTRDDLRETIGGVIEDLELNDEPPELLGEDHRVKAPESLERKYLTERKPGETVPDFVERQNDLIRFSIQLPEGEDYRPAFEATLGQLQERGYEVVDIKNFWKADNRYLGMNTTVKSPDGAQFELQFPTADSWRANKLTHEYYEVFRNKDEPIERRVHALLRTLRVNKELGLPDRIPPGIESRWAPADTGFETWRRKHPDLWADYDDWLENNGRDPEWAARQFELGTAQFSGHNEEIRE